MKSKALLFASWGSRKTIPFYFFVWGILIRGVIVDEFIVNIIVLFSIYLMLRHYALKTKATSYNAYLSSQHWKSLRQKVLARDNYRCTDCHSPINLHVHHLSYSHLGKERMYELETLCSRCHRYRHNKH
jgi:hypothetical protein